MIDLDLATRKAIQFDEIDIAALRQALSRYADLGSKIGTSKPACPRAATKNEMAL